MYARVPTFKIGADNIESAMRQFEDVSLPQLRKLPGFKGATMLVNREKGMFQIVAYWDSREALDSSAEATRALREEAAKKLNAELVSLEIWEVAVDVYFEAL
jgi:heme-degrading monooxygenase HmoA